MDSISEIVKISKQNGIAESGGGHNQKGIDYQRYWAIYRMFELEESGAKDFLILIEAIQDVAEFDAVTNPTAVCIYQVKKKDRGEWSWSELTNLIKPGSKSKPTKKEKKVSDSMIGKLSTAVIAFTKIKSSGRFISNRGCNIPLALGGNAATSLPVSISKIQTDHYTKLKAELVPLIEPTEIERLLSSIYLEKASLPVDAPRTHLVGVVHQFLLKRSPRHAGQARSLVDALMASTGGLGSKTDKCNSFGELCEQHGYCRDQFKASLGKLENIPDVLEHLEHALVELKSEGFGFMDIISIKMESSSIYRRQVMGDNLTEELDLISDCDAELDETPLQTPILPNLEKVYNKLKISHNSFSKLQIYAHYLIRAILKCANPM